MARDLMFQQEIKDTVQRAYAAIASGAGATVARRHYSDQELAEVPHGAIEWALGVGNPVRYARLRPGQVVLDPRAVPSAWTSWRRCASAAVATPPRPRSRAGPSSGRGRWRTFHCLTGQSTWRSPTGC